MAIEERIFDSEIELDSWVQNNYKLFFGDVIYIPGNFFIYTKRDKGGKPDGFVLDLANSSWTLVETELLRHGVWDHIAEQIMRFIVAVRNDSSQRKIRDLFFNEIEKRNLIAALSEKLSQPQSRLLQKIETIIETQTPEIAIFIDNVNEDLEDMIEALNAPVKVFKIQSIWLTGKLNTSHPRAAKLLLKLLSKKSRILAACVGPRFDGRRRILRDFR